MTSPSQKLSPDEVKTIHECIKATAYGPFFIKKDDLEWSYSEIKLIFGISIEEIRNIAETIPNIDINTENSKHLINSCFNNLLGYFHRCLEKTWSKYISISEEDLKNLYDKWKVVSGYNVL